MFPKEFHQAVFPSCRVVVFVAVVPSCQPPVVLLAGLGIPKGDAIDSVD